MSDILFLSYQELPEKRRAPGTMIMSLRELASDVPHEDEAGILAYLRSAPAYSAMGNIVGDVLNPDADARLFPGTKTDGIYLWPAELNYYVAKYHIRLPEAFVARMRSLNWVPPAPDAIDWNVLFRRVADAYGIPHPP